MNTEGWPIVIAVCCREWPVFAAVPLGRCGYCKQRPVIRRER
jgi:hypothetical protein